MAGDKKKSFWKDGLSINESKVSILMISLIIFLGVILYVRMKEGKIDYELLEITKTLIYAVAGVNAVNVFNSNSFDNRI